MYQKPVIFYDNLLVDSTLTATATATDYDVDNLKDYRVFTEWLGVGTGVQYVTADYGSAKIADSFGLINHNLFSIDSTVSIECSSDNFSGDITVALAGFTPSDDKAFMKQFTPQTKRYWRIKFAGAMSAAPLMGQPFIGEALEMEKYISGNYNPTPERIESSSSRGRKGGHYLGSVVENILLPFRPRWRRLTDSWVEANFRPAWDDHLSLLKPFFWAWEPGDHPADVFYAVLPDRARLNMPFDPVRRSLSLEFDGVKEL